jgi:2-amino-4-hydroxy-6-hydroxymethyldihydropteridine diphosphokinase
MTPERAFIGLGGNIGDPAAAMASALRALDGDAGTRVTDVSPLYRTPPWGRTDQPDFLNAVAEIRTLHEPLALLDLCLAIERGLKRVRRERWGPRIIDIDILLYAGRRVNVPGLEIPHPRMLERAFVLVPLADIAPDLEIGGRIAAAHAAAMRSERMTCLSADGNWWKDG